MMRVAALLLAASAAAWAAPQCTVQWTHGPQKIRPYSREVVAPPGPLVCARNADCSLQLVVTARQRTCSGARVRLGDLRSDGDATIPASAVRLYRQAFVNVFYRSSEQGDIGEWPDPLIPEVDPDYHEPRNAFPVDVTLISPAYKSYRAENGRAISKGRSKGYTEARGAYLSHRHQRFVVQVTRGGALGEARFQWWSEPGLLARSSEMPVQGEETPLADGLRIAFHGEGKPDDFLAGDEFWVFAGPARRQPVWADVFIAPDAPPGKYRGSAHVSFDDAPSQEIPIEMEIAPVNLPSTSSLATHFGFYLRGTYEFHYGFEREDARMRELNRTYMQAGLRNRVSLEWAEDFEPAYEFTDDGRLKSSDYGRFDAAWSDFLDGRSTPVGARLTSFRVPRLRRLKGQQFVTAMRDFVAHTRTKGWSDRLFDYTFDEPGSPQQYAALRARAEAMRTAAPEVPRLVTTSLQRDLFGVVTRWCPIVESYFAQPQAIVGPRSLLNWWRERNAWRPTPQAYAERLHAGDSLWLYISCMGHGCAGAGRFPAQQNWPTYVIDAPAIVNQIAGTLAGTTPGMSGFLFWDTTYAHHHEGGPPRQDLTPWETTYYFGGNGDGSLLYPGLPEIVGGKTHVAIESLRLKFIRESLVDAELFRMAQRAGREASAQAALRKVLRSPTDWVADPELWVEFRTQLMSVISN